MPEIERIHHVGLTVSDVEASARWYEEVLAFTRSGGYEALHGERRKVFLRHPRLNIRLGLVQHAHGSERPFDETECGLDHLAFKVSSHAELQRWTEQLTQAHVAFSPIADSFTVPGAAVLVFRDPDNIQLELFADPE